MKRNLLASITGGVLLILFALLLFTYQVRVTEVVVVTTFGKPSLTHTLPGLYGKWPWPIQKVHRFDKRVQYFEDKYEQTALTNQVPVMVMAYAGWHISNPAVFFPKFNGSVPDAERSLEQSLRTAKAEVLGKTRFSDLISADEKVSRLQQVEADILRRVQAQMQAGNYGMQVEFVGIKRLGLPESVTTKVFERMSKERDVLVSAIEGEGTTAAANIRSAAEREAANLVSQADAEATRIRGAGEAEAAKSYALFEKNPELQNFLLKLQALENTLKGSSTLILDQQTPPLDLLVPPKKK